MGLPCSRFSREQLVVTYVDENGQKLIREKWISKGGTVSGSAELLNHEPGFEWYRPIEDLVI